MVSAWSVILVVAVRESDTIIYIITGAVNKFVTSTTVTTVLCNFINAYSISATWISYDVIFMERSRQMSLFGCKVKKVLKLRISHEQIPGSIFYTNPIFTLPNKVTGILVLQLKTDPIQSLMSWHVQYRNS